MSLLKIEPEKAFYGHAACTVQCKAVEWCRAVEQVQCKEHKTGQQKVQFYDKDDLQYFVHLVTLLFYAAL